MKVLFLFGGMPHYLSALLSKLQQNAGMEVCVIIPETKGKSIGKGVKLEEEDHGFKIIRLVEYNSFFFRKPFFKNLNQVINSEQPDIIVTGWPYIVPLSLKFGLLWQIKRKGIGLVFREIPFNVAPYNEALSYFKKNPIYDEDLNNITPKGLKFFFWAITLKFLLLWCYSIVDATLAYASKAIKIHKSYGLKNEQIFISCNSPETESLFIEKARILNSHLEIDYNPYRLIHIGRLVKWKKVDLLIEVLADLIKDFPQTELIIIGKGPEEDNLIVQAEQLGISKKVNFAGSIYKEDLAKHILSSGLYVLAGMGGLSINEAMAFGKPVICSVCDGTEKTLVREGFNGLYFEDGDKESLKSKIAYLFNNKDLIEKMGGNSEAIIRNEVNLDTVTKEFLRCFNYVYQKKKS